MMSRPILAHQNGTTRSTNGTRAPARVVPLLGPQIDHLLEFRGLIRRAQEEERTMTAEVLQAMAAAGVERLAGRVAVAIREQRTTLHPDPQLFHEALGARAYEAMTVGLTAARRLMGADDLVAISETTTNAVLHVELLAASTKEDPDGPA